MDGLEAKSTGNHPQPGYTSTADDDPRSGIGHRDGVAGLRTADGELPARPRFLGLARPCAATAHRRGEAEARQNIEEAPVRSQTAPDHRSHGSCPAGDPARREHGSVADREAGTQAEDGGCRRTRQQDGADGLGAEHEGGYLSGSRCRLTGRREAEGRSRSGRKLPPDVGRTRERIGANGLEDGIDKTSKRSGAFELASSIRIRSYEHHTGPRPTKAAPRGRTNDST